MARKSAARDLFWQAAEAVRCAQAATPAVVPPPGKQDAAPEPGDAAIAAEEAPPIVPDTTEPLAPPPATLSRLAALSAPSELTDLLPRLPREGATGADDSELDRLLTLEPQRFAALDLSLQQLPPPVAAAPFSAPVARLSRSPLSQDLSNPDNSIDDFIVAAPVNGTAGNDVIDASDLRVFPDGTAKLQSDNSDVNLPFEQQARRHLAQRIFGLDGDDLIMGNRGNDYIDGGAGNDTLYGGRPLADPNGSTPLLTANAFEFDAQGQQLFETSKQDTKTGADTLVGGGGQDLLFGGSGDDVLVVPDALFRLADGGRFGVTNDQVGFPPNVTGAIDVLRLESAGAALDFSSPAQIGGLALVDRVRNIEVIDLGSNGNNILIINAPQIELITDDDVGLPGSDERLSADDPGDTLFVVGGAGDTLITSGWTLAASNVSGAQTPLNTAAINLNKYVQSVGGDVITLYVDTVVAQAGIT